MNNANERPLVSVIMPAYNGEKYIREAIESILGQTYSNFELIIIEDCSQDATLDIILSYSDSRIRVIQNVTNRGISYSTNRGTEIANGKYIALLDDDDMATSNRLELQVNYLETHPEVDVLGGRSIDIDAEGEFIQYDDEPIRNPKLIKAFLLFYNKKFANCTVMYRKDFVIKNNIIYQDGYLGMQDLKFYIDCSKVGTIGSIDNVLHLKRIHNGEETVKQRTNNGKNRKAIFAQMQRESIMRSGFVLTEEELEVIHECIPEVLPISFSVEQLKKLYKVFLKMISQAKYMRIDYQFELELACKKIMGERILTRTEIFSDDLLSVNQIGDDL